MNIRRQFAIQLDPEIKHMCRVLRLNLTPETPIDTIRGIYRVLLHMCVPSCLGLYHPDLDALFKDVEDMVCRAAKDGRS